MHARQGRGLRSGTLRQILSTSNRRVLALILRLRQQQRLDHRRRTQLHFRADMALMALDHAVPPVNGPHRSVPRLVAGRAATLNNGRTGRDLRETRGIALFDGRGRENGLPCQ